jgi:hypothetical protein
VRGDKKAFQRQLMRMGNRNLSWFLLFTSQVIAIVRS